MNVDTDVEDELLDRKLYSLCVQGWQAHREIAAMQVALRAANPHRPVLPPGVQARAIVPRELAAPFDPVGRWHQLLVTSEYAFKCAGAERVEQLDWSDLQQGLRRQFRRATERTLQLQRISKRGSHTLEHTRAVQLVCIPQAHLCKLYVLWCCRRATVPSAQRGADRQVDADCRLSQARSAKT